MKKSSKSIRSLVGKRFFGVKFVKRTDNSVRTMLCKLGVVNWGGDKQITGGGLKFDPEAKRLLPVFDVNKRAYRMVNLDTIIHLRFGGKTYKFK